MNPHVTGGRPTHEGLAGVRPGAHYAAGGGGGGFGGLGGGGFGGFGGSMGQPIQLIRSGAHRPFAERSLWNIDSGSASVHLDVEGADHLAPLLGFFGDELAEVAGRAWKYSATKVGKARLHPGVGKPCIDLAVNLLDDFGRRGLWCADALPIARFVAWHELSHGRDVRQRLRASGRGDRERAQPASPDIFHRFDSGSEHDLHPPGDEIGDRRAATTIGHVNHVDAGHHVEQLAREMGRGSLPRAASVIVPSRFRNEPAWTNKPAAPAFAIPLRTSESWRPSVAG